MSNSNNAAENNNKDGRVETGINIPNGWKPSLYMPWKKKKMSKDIAADDMKMGRLLAGESPSPEDANLAAGAIRRKKKTFEVFHGKFMLLSVLFVFGLCGTTVMWFTTIYSEQIFKTLTLGNGTKLHLAWKNPPLEPLLCVHIFNYTNSEQFFDLMNKPEPSVKLQVQDTGPYCFRERIERTQIEFINNGTQMSYREQRIHTFDAEASNGSLNDTVFVPNVLILSVYKEIAELTPLLRIGAQTALGGSKIITDMKVSEYLLGYEDETFTMIGTLHGMFSTDNRQLPKKFGILQKRVGLSNDTVVINTGDSNLDEMGQVVEINNITEFTAWVSDDCNRVTGSDGLFFRRSLVQSLQPVQLFHKDSCRTLPLVFNETVQLPGGIAANRYVLKSDIFDSKKTENRCFYNNSKIPSRYGVLEISSCSAVSGAPMVLSRPHFLDSNVNIDQNGDEVILGMKPNRSAHDFHIDIFPAIGLTVRTLMRMQMNIAVKNPYGDVTLNPLADETVLPIAWVEMNSGETVPEKMFSLLYHLSCTMKWAELVLKWTFLLFTFLMAFVLFKISFAKSSKKEMVVISKT